MDLQENVKAQENLAYALKVKISNLQKMAETLVWVQESNINDLTELNDLCKAAQANAQAAYERLSQAEDELYKTNEQIHYAGQYLSTQPFFCERVMRSSNKTYVNRAVWERLICSRNFG